MALKINAPIISRNHGLLTGAVVRIENYRVNKYAGQAEVTVLMFKDEQDAELSKYSYADEVNAPIQLRRPLPAVVQVELVYEEKEIEYPTYLEFPLYTPETSIVDVYEERMVTETYNDFDEEGNVIQKSREKMASVKTGTKEVVRQKLDISIVESHLYSWCYARVKEKFGEIFGIENISDC
jgi:hypothetical protein